VSGGVLKASDFLGLAPQNTSQFAADDGYSQLAETARNFAAASANMQGYEMYGDYQSTSAQQSTTPFAQQGQSQKRGGSNSSSSMFTAYGGYTSRAGTSQVRLLPVPPSTYRYTLWFKVNVDLYHRISCTSLASKALRYDTYYTRVHTVLPATKHEPYLPLFPAAEHHHHLTGTHSAYPQKDGQAEPNISHG